MVAESNEIFVTIPGAHSQTDKHKLVRFLEKYIAYQQVDFPILKTHLS